jgi:hypothetical protein
MLKKCQKIAEKFIRSDHVHVPKKGQKSADKFICSDHIDAPRKGHLFGWENHM